MGKSRRNRGAKAHRSDPIAKTVKPPSDPELAALRESRILPVIQDLKSPDPKSRTAAAGAIANIVQDAKCRKLLLREQIVHTLLTETLTDSNIESRAAGWEILKVLAEEEDSDFCVHLFRVDILTALQHAAKAVAETLTALEPPFSKLLKAQQTVVWEITKSLVYLLGALAGTRDEIFDAIVADQILVQFLFCVVTAQVAPRNVVDETLQCLMLLAEDNLKLGQAAIDNKLYNDLLKFISGGGSRAVLACGVLHNVFTSLQWLDHSPGKDGASDAILIPTLARILEQTSLRNGATNGQEGPSPADILQTALEVLASIGTDLQGALEKGNREQDWNGFEDGLGGGLVDDNDDNAMEIDEDDGKPAAESDDELDAELDEDMDKVLGDELGPDTPSLDAPPTLRELLQKAVPQIIRLSNTAPASEEAASIQNLAMSALNNIAWTMACIEFANGENTNIFRAWAPVAKRIWSRTITPTLASDNADIILATTAASLAWALSSSLGGSTPLNGNEHLKFIALYQASRGLPKDTESAGREAQSEDPFQSVEVKCIGVLGQLARDPAPIDINRDIGVFLITVLASPESPPAGVIEALNQLFEIYGDETLPCAEVFWKHDFLKHMEDTLPKARAMAKAIDNKAGELKQRADEVVLNLGRFIQYIKKHKPSTTA